MFIPVPLPVVVSAGGIDDSIGPRYDTTTGKRKRVIPSQRCSVGFLSIQNEGFSVAVIVENRIIRDREIVFLVIVAFIREESTSRQSLRSL